jgi:hypothetical protein
MSLENKIIESDRDGVPDVRIEIEHGFEDFVPEVFKQDPIKYFENEGVNIKSGEVKIDDAGVVREDPTTVKVLPAWTSISGEVMEVVGKRVNVAKSKVGESGDPFYEYKIMEMVREVGLPTSKPVVKVECGGVHLIVMEKLKGINWWSKDKLGLKERGYSGSDIEDLKSQAEVLMDDMKNKFEQAGIERGWKLKDMVFDIDIENKKVSRITPVDWERTKINQEKYSIYKQKYSTLMR